MACMLWEDSFYEDGKAIADRIAELVHKLTGDQVAQVAIEARTKMKLRHVPLLMARELARHPSIGERRFVGDLLESIIQRPDELTEFLAIYQRENRQSLGASVKRGLAKAFTKFDEYALAKYNRDGAFKLKDVLFLVHAKPKDEEQGEMWGRLIKGTLKTPDTWEVELSAGKGKKETFERLMQEDKLGALALLRNLRNMQQAGCSDELIREALGKMKIERVLPLRFITAARYAPKLEPELEAAMYKCVAGMEKLAGKTVLLVDVSGSMTSKISDKTEINRIDAANGLAILLRELCDTCVVYTFSTGPKLVPARRGFALRDAIMAQFGGSTNTEIAKKQADAEGYDRLIILTDEQSHQALSNPLTDKGYVINVAAYRNGIGYGKWVHVDGWSEAVVEYIRAWESLQ